MKSGPLASVHEKILLFIIQYRTYRVLLKIGSAYKKNISYNIKIKNFVFYYQEKIEIFILIPVLLYCWSMHRYYIQMADKW
jgi:hypothetical protein